MAPSFPFPPKAPEIRPRQLFSALYPVLVFVGLSVEAAQADNSTVSVNYVYAAQLGIGQYDIGGLSVDVFTLPLSITRRFDDVLGMDDPNSPTGDWDVRFKFPVSLGLYRFKPDDPALAGVEIRQKTLAIVPGLELIAPITDTWSLKPEFNFGAGQVFDSQGPGASSENQFLVYTAGLRSRVELPAGNYTFAIGNGVFFAGNREPATDSSENYWAIEAGLQVRRSLGFTLSDLGITHSAFKSVEPEIGFYSVLYHYPDPLEFDRYRQSPLEVRNQIELGLTLGSVSPWDLWIYSDPEIGLSYITGDGLDILRINFGFPF